MTKRPVILVLALGFFGATYALAADAPGKDAPPPPPPPRHGPPPGAFAACKDLKTDAACMFSNREGKKITGKCWSPEPSKLLGCRPGGAPGKDVPPPPPPPHDD